MEVREVSSWKEFVLIIDDQRKRYIYRGAKDPDYQLIPKAGRVSGPINLELLKWNERRLFREFKRKALPYVRNRPADDAEWLVLAQHHGMPTRLLDWTESVLVAAYFATEGSVPRECAIYVLEVDRLNDLEGDPFDIEILSNVVDGRMIRRRPSAVFD